MTAKKNKPKNRLRLPNDYSSSPLLIPLGLMVLAL